MKTSFLKTAVFVCIGLISALTLFGQSNVIDSLTQGLQKTPFDILLKLTNLLNAKINSVIA